MEMPCLGDGKQILSTETLDIIYEGVYPCPSELAAPVYRMN
jgi:hypothetical protein